MGDADRIRQARDMIDKGMLNTIFNDPDKIEQHPNPIFQCVQIKALANTDPSAAERYRIVLSDVNNFVQSMLATQANSVVHEGKLKKGSIVRLKSFQANAVKGKKILIILDLDVIENMGELEKIGEPVALAVKEVGEDTKPANTTIASNGFYASKPQAPAQDRTLPSRSAAPNSNSNSATIYPIEGLSPYAHKWTIKARITNKSDVRTWHRNNSEGKLFSVNLLDESGEIKATGFNQECDKLYDVFQEGSVYYISTPCKVQLAKKQFSNLPNDYELVFESGTTVEKAEDGDSVPQVKYQFATIADLQTVEKDSVIDTIGVLKEVQELSQIVSKSTQKPYDKRDMTLVDDSGYSVKMTIWGKSAMAFDAMPESIVAFKGAKVSDFNGRSLSLLGSGSMTIDPDIPEAHKLKGWYDSQGRTESFASHSNMQSAGAAGGRKEKSKTISQVRDENLGMNDEPDYFSMTATIVFIKPDNFSYPACASENCSKKVVDNNDGTWRCEKCEINHPKPEHRYIMQLNVNDHTGQLYLSCFDDVGRMVMGTSADQLMQYAEDGEAIAKDKVFADAMCKTYNFRVRAKMDTFQEQQRIRYQVMSATPINYTTDAHKLVELIKQYNID